MSLESTVTPTFHHAFQASTPGHLQRKPFAFDPPSAAQIAAASATLRAAYPGVPDEEITARAQQQCLSNLEHLLCARLEQNLSCHLCASNSGSGAAPNHRRSEDIRESAHALRLSTALQFLEVFRGRAVLTPETMKDINVRWAGLELMALNADQQADTRRCPGMLKRLQEASAMADCREALRREFEAASETAWAESWPAKPDLEAAKREGDRIWREAEEYTEWCEQQDGQADQALRDLGRDLAEIEKW
ncbi:hypothetical protein QTJ16_001512 [Diplocarpon rosae]|uniref:Uncharacterized protein n=1 Tax=Diplocarpon rosae TaxID=946125 RepID=A0AAD9T445_9HELO|nr:hypothetical protein QTJ16_001512 [Diplocarpon rosae]